MVTETQSSSIYIQLSISIYCLSTNYIILFFHCEGSHFCCEGINFYPKVVILPSIFTKCICNENSPKTNFMKRLLFSLILAILLPLFAMAQSVPVSFTGRDANNH